MSRLVSRQVTDRGKCVLSLPGKGMERESSLVNGHHSLCDQGAGADTQLPGLEGVV